MKSFSLGFFLLVPLLGASQTFLSQTVLPAERLPERHFADYVRPAPDGGNIVVGKRLRTDGMAIFYRRNDRFGNILASHTLSVPGYKQSSPEAMVVAPDGGAYVVFSHDIGEHSLARLGPRGEWLWSRSFGDGASLQEWGYALTMVGSDRVVIAGESLPVGFRASASLFRMVDSAGRTVWSQTVDLDPTAYEYSEFIDYGNGVLVAAVTRDGSPSLRIDALRLDVNTGRVLWRSAYPRELAQSTNLRVLDIRAPGPGRARVALVAQESGSSPQVGVAFLNPTNGGRLAMSRIVSGGSPTEQVFHLAASRFDGLLWMAARGTAGERLVAVNERGQQLWDVPIALPGTIGGLATVDGPTSPRFIYAASSDGGSVHVQRFDWPTRGSSMASAPVLNLTWVNDLAGNSDGSVSVVGDAPTDQPDASVFQLRFSPALQIAYYDRFTALSPQSASWSGLAADTAGNAYTLVRSEGSIGGGLARRLAKMTPTGTRAWSVPIPGSTSSSPFILVANGVRPVLAVFDQDAFTLYGIDPLTGARRWERAFPGLQFQRWIALANGDVLVSSSSGGPTARLSRVDTATGDVRWTSQIDPPAGMSFIQPNALAESTGGTLWTIGFDFSSSFVFRVRADGTPLGPAVRYANLGLASIIRSDRNGGVIVAGRDDNTVYVQRFGPTGLPAWTRPIILGGTPTADLADLAVDARGFATLVCQLRLDHGHDIGMAVRIEPTGRIAWTREIPGTMLQGDYYEDLVAMPDGTVVVVGGRYDAVRDHLALWRISPAGVVSPPVLWKTTERSVSSYVDRRPEVVGNTLLVPIEATGVGTPSSGLSRGAVLARFRIP